MGGILVESSNKKIILIALIMAVLASFLIYIYIKQMTVKPEIKIDYINVYVAVKTLPAKYKVTDKDLKLIKVTKEYLNTQAVLNKENIIGKRLNDRIIEGEQILKDRLVDEKNSALIFNIPNGKRAVSININDQNGVSNLIKPGDYIDVLVSFDKEEIDLGTEKIVYPKVSKMIIQNVELLALGQIQTPTEEVSKEQPKTATLALTPQEAEKLVFASDFGVVRLTLRGVEDFKSVDTQGIIRNDLIQDKGVTITKKQ